jgi:hypothetical protein
LQDYVRIDMLKQVLAVPTCSRQMNIGDGFLVEHR